MRRLPPWFQWLALAALADWLIGRTITRSAIFMPKSPLVLAAYEGLTYVAALAATLSTLLALGALAWIAWQSWVDRRAVLWPITLLGLGALSLARVVAGAPPELTLLFHLLLLSAVGLLVRDHLSTAGVHRAWVALLPASALAACALYQMGPAVYQALRLPGPSPFAHALFNLGEVLVVLSPIGLWWAYGRQASGRAWLIALVPALAFSALRWLNPSMAGILAVWSTGLTLYLPWPLYAISLWLACLTVMATWQRPASAGWALLLLAAGGYAPQLSVHAFLGLIGLWLLSRSEADAPVSKAVPGLQPADLRAHPT